MTLEQIWKEVSTIYSSLPNATEEQVAIEKFKLPPEAFPFIISSRKFCKRKFQKSSQWNILQEIRICNDFWIYSHDNFYLIYLFSETTQQVRIEISKEYNLPIGCCKNDVRYNLIVENDGKIEIDEKYKLKIVNKCLLPHIRSSKLDRIGI